MTDDEKKIPDTEALMILDGLYGAISVIVQNNENKLLTQDLGFHILYQLKKLLLKYGMQEKEFFTKYNGMILKKENIREFSKKVRKERWIAITGKTY